MTQIKTYGEIAISMAQLQKRVWTDLQDRCNLVMNQLALAESEGRVPACRELAMCKSIWSEYKALPLTIRNQPSTEWTSELTAMLDLCNEIPNFYVRAR